MSPTLDEKLVGRVMKQLSRVFENERDFVRLVMEILSDVRDPLDMFTSEEAEQNFALQVFPYLFPFLSLPFFSPFSLYQSDRLIELNDKILELSEQKEKYIRQERFQAAGKIKDKLDKLEEEFENLQAMAQDREDIEEFVYTRFFFFQFSLPFFPF